VVCSLFGRVFSECLSLQFHSLRYFLLFFARFGFPISLNVYSGFCHFLLPPSPPLSPLQESRFSCRFRLFPVFVAFHPFRSSFGGGNLCVLFLLLFFFLWRVKSDGPIWSDTFPPFPQLAVVIWLLLAELCPLLPPVFVFYFLDTLFQPSTCLPCAPLSHLISMVRNFSLLSPPLIFPLFILVVFFLLWGGRTLPLFFFQAFFRGTILPLFSLSHFSCFFCLPFQPFWSSPLLDGLARPSCIGPFSPFRLFFSPPSQVIFPFLP